MDENERPDEHDAQKRLLLAAQEEFAERGFDGATIRDICRKAGANVASINYYFGGKDGLYIEAVKSAHSCTFPIGAFQSQPAGTPAVEKLRRFIGEMVARMHEPISPTAMKLIMREMADPGKAGHIVVKEFIQPAAFTLRDILQELLPAVDEPHRMAVGFSIIGQILFYRQNRPIAELIFGKDAFESIGIELVSDHVICFTLAALGLGEPPYQTVSKKSASESA